MLTVDTSSNVYYVMTRDDLNFKIHNRKIKSIIEIVENVQN